MGDAPIWLLMVAGVRFASGVWSDTVRSRTFTSDFDRLFYVDGYDGGGFQVSNGRRPRPG